MKTKSKNSKKFAVFCFSDMLQDFTPSLWPNSDSESEAKTLATKKVQFGTKYEIRPVIVTEQIQAPAHQRAATVQDKLRALLIGARLPFAIANSKTGVILAPSNRRLQRFHVKRLIANRATLELPACALADKITGYLDARK